MSCHAQMPNQFSAKYKTLPTEKLLEILANKPDYQLPAIQAAEEELAARNLSEEEMNDARQKFEAAEQQKVQARQKKQEQIDRVTTQANKVTLLLDPLAKKTDTRSLNIILVVLSVLALYQLGTSYRFYLNMFSGSFSLNMTVAYALVNQLGLPVILYLVWKRLEVGRLLMIAWCALNLLMTAINIYYLWELRNIDNSLSHLLPLPDLGTFVFFILVKIGLIYFFSKKSVKCLFVTEKSEREDI